MGLSLRKKQKIYYFNPKETYSIYDFCATLTQLIRKKASANQELVLVCIGSDRATGDCLGPIIGHKLSKYVGPDFSVYGTLEEPVHAKNLEETLDLISEKHLDPIVIAIDASLGNSNHLGYCPGADGAPAHGT